MQQSETNTLAAALTTMMAGASALSTLANTDIIEVRNSAGALKGKITAQNLAAFAAGSVFSKFEVVVITSTIDNYKVDFQNWFNSAADKIYLVCLSRGAVRFLLGYKKTMSSGVYGGFVQIDYNGNLTRFCGVNRGVFDFAD